MKNAAFVFDLSAIRSTRPSPQGMFSLQVLGAVAQLERALIAERTKAGIKAAKARGKLPGNPGLRKRRSEAIEALSKAQILDHSVR